MAENTSTPKDDDDLKEIATLGVRMLQAGKRHGPVIALTVTVLGFVYQTASSVCSWVASEVVSPFVHGQMDLMAEQKKALSAFQEGFKIQTELIRSIDANIRKLSEGDNSEIRPRNGDRSSSEPSPRAGSPEGSETVLVDPGKT